MASPPYNHSFSSSTSPPYPSPTTLPPTSKKRASDMLSAPATKRRKPSLMSTTSSNLSVHPLRQTSFPPDGTESVRYSRSPSMDTMSMVSGSQTGPVKKKRGRKSKGAVNDDTASLAGGKALTAVSGASGRGGRGTSRGADVEEEEDDADEDTAVTVAARTQEEKEKENRYRAMLFERFDKMQQRRYELWRSARFSESVIRRLVNQTLSQSAPASVILAVRFVTKVFAGEIIERARKVQSQWLEATQESQTGLQSPPLSESEERHKETRRGPLTPDHLREALRRLKLERGGGAVGLLALWKLQQHSGVERFGLKVQGKRLLK